MWKTSPPSRTASQVVIACSKGTNNTDLKSRLTAEVSKIQANSNVYQQHAADGTCHLIVSQTFTAQFISDDEFRWLYKEGLVRGKSGREIYNTIMRGAPNKRCCYCQCGIATTLDHFVPKSISPALAIDPWNLIPCCKDCNHTLGSIFGTTSAEELLHPYSMPTIGRWLYAEISTKKPVTLNFFARPDASLQFLLQNRIVNQFEKLQLSNMYAAVSVQDIITIASNLLKLPDTRSVKAHLHEMKEFSRSAGMNSLRPVIYEALEADDWYCQGGFRD